MTIDRIPMTREGFEKKKVELDQMKTEMTRITDLPQSRVSTHLGKLREAGVLRDRREGASTYYSMNDGAMPPCPSRGTHQTPSPRSSAFDSGSDAHGSHHMLVHAYSRNTVRISSRRTCWAKSAL